MHLVYFIHYTEGTAGDVLKGHEVHHCGDAPLSTTLTVGIQHMEIILISKLNPYLHTIFAEILGGKRVKKRTRSLWKQGGVAYIIMLQKGHLPRAAHLTKKPTEALVDFLHHLLQWDQPPVRQEDIGMIAL